MSKKRLISLLVLSLLVIALATVLAGCDQLSSLMGSKHDITWTIEFDKEASENAVITVMGYDKLPTKIPAGEEITVTIEGINGYKVHRVKINNRKTLPDENGNYDCLGYKVTVCGVTLFHAGDCCLYDGLCERVKGSDIMMLPVNGRSYFQRYVRDIIGNMTAAEAAELCLAVGAKMLIPMHFDLYSVNCVATSTVVEQIEATAKKLPYHIFKPGERYVYHK